MFWFFVCLTYTGSKVVDQRALKGKVGGQGGGAYQACKVTPLGAPGAVFPSWTREKVALCDIQNCRVVVQAPQLLEAFQSTSY